MIIDNLFSLDRIKQISATDGRPEIVEVASNGTNAAGEFIDRLFVNDTVSFLGVDWRVWDISGPTITLVRL